MTVSPAQTRNANGPQTPHPAAVPSATARNPEKPPIDMQLLKTWVGFQTWVIAGLAAVIFVVLPFVEPSYLYYAKSPDQVDTRIVGMEMPNMTNQAVLSWATTSITEIMTMGFGDFDVKLPQQKWRFTQGGWKAYVKSFVDQKIGATFRQNQLVLTTVPSNTPVITWRGVNEENVYSWVVQMPVIMNYETNDNKNSKKTAIVSLTIVRVPTDESPSGIAIRDWQLN